MNEITFDRDFTSSTNASRMCLRQDCHENRSFTIIECSGV